MRNSGVQIDPLTGQPVNLQDGHYRSAAGKADRLASLQLQGQNLRAELMQDQGEVLKALEAEMLARALKLVANDPEYQALSRLAQRIGAKLNIIPAMIRQELRRVMGDEIYRMTGNLAAPEGIPAEE